MTTIFWPKRNNTFLAGIHNFDKERASGMKKRFDRRKNKDKIVGTDSLGRPIWASSIPDDDIIKSIGDIALQDGEAIKREFYQKSKDAAHALALGDKDAYLKAHEEASRTHFALKKWSFLMDSMPKRRARFQEWSQSYENFRTEAHLHKEEEERQAIPVVQRYKDSQSSKESVRVAAEYIRAAYKADVEEYDEYAEAYDDAVAGISSAVSSKKDKKAMSTEEKIQEKERERERREELSSLPKRIRKAVENEYPSYSVKRNGKSVKVYMTPGGRPIYGENEDGEYYSKKDQKEHDRNQRARKRKDMISDPSVGLGEMIYQGIEGMVSSVERSTGVDKFGGLRFTMRPHVGPFVINIGRGGLSSISLKAGPARYRIWSRKSAPGFSSLDLPGYLSFRGKEESKRK